MIKTCVETKPKVTPEAIAAAWNETIENQPILRAIPLGNTSDQKREALALLTSKKWENGRTLRVWLDSAGAGVAERVRPYFLRWTQYANIHFEFVLEREAAEIRVGFAEGMGSWSYMGTDALTIPKNEHTMNFGWLTPGESETEFRRVVLHEAGHALGAIHEHQNPSGGIPWDRETVIRYYSGPPNNWSLEDIEHNIFYRYSESQTNFTRFDPHSIMAYPVPNEFTIGDFHVPFNTDLSEQDEAFMAWCYPPADEPPDPLKGLPRVPVSRYAKAGLGKECVVTKDGKAAAYSRPLGSTP